MSLTSQCGIFSNSYLLLLLFVNSQGPNSDFLTILPWLMPDKPRLFYRSKGKPSGIKELKLLFMMNMDAFSAYTLTFMYNRWSSTFHVHQHQSVLLFDICLISWIERWFHIRVISYSDILLSSTRTENRKFCPFSPYCVSVLLLTTIQRWIISDKEC